MCDKLRKVLANQDEAIKRTLEEATEELEKAKRVRASKQDEVQDKQSEIRRKEMILDGHAKYRDELNALDLRNKGARESDERELDDLNAQLAVLTEDLSQLDEAVKQSEQKLEDAHRIIENKPELPEVAEMQSQIDRLTA